MTDPSEKWKFILSHYSFCAILKAIKEGFILRDNNVEIRKREIHKVHVFRRGEKQAKIIIMCKFSVN